MEIAIPLLALGGMFVISNSKQSSSSSQQPPLVLPPREAFAGRNYPISFPRSDGMVSGASTGAGTVAGAVDPADPLEHNGYAQSTAATNAYFDQTRYAQNERRGVAVGNTLPQVYALQQPPQQQQQQQQQSMPLLGTGTSAPGALTHNNMVAINGGKVRGRNYAVDMAEPILDNYNGSASQVARKVEQAPLFKPEDNMSWAYGTPNQSEFMQSRMQSGMRQNNVKPFDSIAVGPGLDRGYGIDGSNGFNSGMEARDKWMPKTVDELRVETNPKLEYSLAGHEGPADAFIKAMPTAQTQGRVEKQRPDTYFANTPDRWFVTTGDTKKNTLRAIQEMGVVRRNDVPVNYVGPAGTMDSTAGMAPRTYEPAKRAEALAGGVNPSAAVGKGEGGVDKERALQSHANYPNHRSTAKQPETFGSGFSRAIGAAVAPFVDIFKPTRKDETMYNARIFGDGAASVSRGPVYDPRQAAPTTVKETTVYAPTFHINNQKEGLYVNTFSAPQSTQRDTTGANEFVGGAIAGGYGTSNYDAAYAQHSNGLKAQTIYNRPNQGGTQIFNQQMNVTCAKTDTDRFAGRMNPAFSSTSSLTPSVQTLGELRAPPQQYDETRNNDRLNPDILSAFRANPYVHSLSSVA